MTKKIAITLLLFCSIIFYADAKIKKTTFSKRGTVEIAKWEVVDISFKAKVDDPFTKQFSAIFRSPDGRAQEVPGFYNGDSEWIIRFSGSTPGLWEYTTTSNVKSLNNKRSSIIIDDKIETVNKGAIIIPRDDKQHFYYEDGTPYFLMAFECDWLYALDYDNDSSIPKTEHLLNLIDDNGFNQVVMNIFSYDIRWGWGKDPLLALHPEHEFGSPKDIYPFGGNNDNPDFSTLNVEFFKKLDRTLEMMHDKNIGSHLMIYVWNKLVAWPEMNSEADNIYFDYVIKRYGAFPNIMWDISKEALHYGRADDNYILDRIDRFQKQNYFDRTLTVHDYEYCVRHPESVDYIARQDWTFDLYNNTIEDHEKYSDKPTFNIEHGGYEESPYVVFPGSYTDAEDCLRRNYQCAFGGGYSTYYWQGTSWNAIIWNPFEQNSTFYKPKLEYFRYMSALFNEFDFSNYNPAPELSREGYCLKSINENDYLFYVPREVFWFHPNAAFKNKKDTVYYRWFNTITGEYTKEVKMDGRSHLISPWHYKDDAVLIMSRESKQTIGSDYIKIECESTKSSLGLWKKVQVTDNNYVKSASSTAYLEFTGNTIDGGDPASTLEYKFVAPKTGSFQLAIRSNKRLEGEPSDKCNDAYVKLSGDFESGNSVPKEALDQFTKLYGGNSSDWGWASHLDSELADHISCIYNLKEGEEYTISIAGRSIRFNIDYILLYSTDSYTINEIDKI